MTAPTPTASIIKALRMATGLKQAEFAALYHITYSTYRNWEQGRVTPPDCTVYMLSRLVAIDFPGSNIYNESNP